MTAKEYYKSTRLVETRNWTLEMTLNFAEEYNEALNKHEDLVCPCCGSDKTYLTNAIHCNRCAVTTEI